MVEEEEAGGGMTSSKDDSGVGGGRNSGVGGGLNSGVCGGWKSGVDGGRLKNKRVRGEEEIGAMNSPVAHMWLRSRRREEFRSWWSLKIGSRRSDRNFQNRF